MAYWRDYHLPTSVSEALELLARYRGQAQVIGGGTDLLLDLQEGEQPAPQALVDVTRIAEMNDIRQEGGWIRLGAAVTHAQIVNSRLLQVHATCLVESCGLIGGPQVRHVATIGGNVVHALPAADGTISLLALGAEGLVAWRDGDGQVCQAWRPLPELFLGPGRSAIDPTSQLLVALRFPALQPREASAFQRIMRPQGVALPILGVAARARFDEDNQRFADVRIAIGPAGPVPFRAQAAEQALRHAIYHDSQALERAIAAAQAEARLRTSRYRATAEYRRHVLGLLLRQVLACAVERARANSQQYY